MKHGTEQEMLLHRKMRRIHLTARKSKQKTPGEVRKQPKQTKTVHKMRKLQFLRVEREDGTRLRLQTPEN